MSTLLSENGIRESLPDAAGEKLDALVVLDVVPSTNSWLMAQQRSEAGRYKVVLSEQQTAGRGRHGKNWASPRGAGLYLSIGYTFHRTPDNLACMTLAAGVATLRALQCAGAEQLGLKWPNDIYGKDAKLGGILVDAQTTSGGHVSIICGIGVNIDFSMTDAQQEGLTDFDYAVTDLKSHCNDLPTRNDAAAAIIERVMDAMAVFEESGLDPFRADWNRHDWLNGKSVDVDMPGDEFDGIADGIDASGALRVKTAQGIRHVHTGTVRVIADAKA